METYGDLKKVITAIKNKQTGTKVGNFAVNVALDFIPGASVAKDTFEFVKSAFNKPDEKKTDSWLDKLDVDDEMSAIVDDTVENGFLKMIAKTIESEPDDKSLEQDFNMNQKMVDYLKQNYSGRTVTGIKESKSSVFDKFFKKFAYKFDKGYPDLKNPKDVALLNTLFENLDIPFTLKEALSKEAQAAKDILKNNFDLEEENFLEMTSTSFKVLMDNSERRDFLRKADEIDDFDFELKGASVGRLKYQPEGQSRPVYVYAKPANVQGLGSAGKQNEANFIDNINAKIQEANGSLDIEITAPNSDPLFTPNVTEVVDSSKTGAGKGDKSDAQFISNGKVVQNISLKQAEGFRWASVKSDPEFAPFIKTFIEKALKGEIKGLKLKRNTEVAGEKYLMYNDEGERVTLIIIDDFPEGFEERVVFGPETPKTVVVGGTFSKDDRDFELQKDKLVVKAAGIYRDLDDIEATGQEPVFIIGQHAKMSYGLDFRIFPANKTKLGPRSRGIRLSYNDIK